MSNNNSTFTTIICLFFLFLSTSVVAQKKLNYDSKGQLSKADYQLLINSKKYQAISAFDTVSTKPLLVYAIYIKNKKLGILDNNAIEITPAIYDGIEGMNIGYTTVMFGFHENFPVKIGQKYGLITNKGKVVLPMEYDYIRGEEKRSIKRTHKKEAKVDSIIIAQKGDEEFYFSPKGKLLNKKVDPSINESIEVVATEQYYSSSDRTPKEQAETTPHGTIYRKLDNGYAIVSAKVENKFYYQGLVELATNKLVLPVVYNSLIIGRKDRIVAVKGKEFTIHNLEGKQLLPESYESIEAFNQIYRIKKGGKYALFDLDFKPISDYIYDSFGSAGPDFMIGKKDGKQGVIETTGKEIIPFIHERIEGYFNRNSSGFAFFKVINDRKEGLISIKGEPLTEMGYDEITPECTIEEHNSYGGETMPIDHDYDAKYNNYFIVKKDNLYGLLDNSFQPLLPIEHDQIKKSFHKDFIIVGKKTERRNYDLSLLNLTTKTTILPYEYNHFKYLGGSYFMTYKNATMGVCNFKGETIIPQGTYRDLADRYYHDVIYRGLSKIDGRKSYYLIDYHGTQIDMLSN